MSRNYEAFNIFRMRMKVAKIVIFFSFLKVKRRFGVVNSEAGSSKILKLDTH